MFHAIGCDLVDLTEAQRDPELASCCLWVYEHTPCSLCPESAVKARLERERAPKTLLLGMSLGLLQGYPRYGEIT